MSTTLVMLHGAGGVGESLAPLANRLRPYVLIETPNLLGHGGRPVPNRYSIREWAEDIVAYLDSRNLDRPFIFGYSFGGYVALYLALHFPQRVRGFCTLAAKYVFDQKTVSHFTYLASRERVERSPNFERFKQLHYPQDALAIAANNFDLFLGLGKDPAISDDDLRAIRVPALIISADQDQLVPVEESLALGQHIPDSRTLMLQGKAHPLEVLPLNAIAEVMADWMNQIENRP